VGYAGTSYRFKMGAGLASLGLASYKNGVYHEIAAGNQSALALATLIWITVICVQNSLSYCLSI
jgi:hypothetical protein